VRITLAVNGEPRQDGSTALMIHRIPELISYLSSIFTLEAGDVILTGTPAGVGPIRSGDEVVAEISEVGSLKVSVS
jgi:2-keto-4-pentenoate hydratase/2-oxohepta-3-ene-1,7-dioic acid hydratase in catechol pathway